MVVVLRRRWCGRGGVRAAGDEGGGAMASNEGGDGESGAHVGASGGGGCRWATGTTGRRRWAQGQGAPIQIAFGRRSEGRRARGEKGVRRG